MPITDWPAAERPREKLLARGPESLSDAELLAIFLRTGINGKTAVDVARELLVIHGGLRPLLTAGREALCMTPGLGDAKYAQLMAALEIGRRHLGETLARGAALGSAHDTRDYLQARLRDLQREVFCALFLDNRHRVLAFEELFAGTLNGTAVYPREVVRRALRHNAAAVIFAHNHPSGEPRPSAEDRAITRQLVFAGRIMGISVHEHVIIGDNRYFSFADQGHIARMNAEFDGGPISGSPEPL